MEQSPSWEASILPDSQETTHLLRNPMFHFRVKKGMQILRPFVTVRKKLYFFHGEELLVRRTTSELEYHPLSVLRGCFFSIFSAIFHIRISSPSAIRWPAMLWWQGPTEHGEILAAKCMWCRIWGIQGDNEHGGNKAVPNVGNLSYHYTLKVEAGSCSEMIPYHVTTPWRWR